MCLASADAASQIVIILLITFQIQQGRRRQGHLRRDRFLQRNELLEGSVKARMEESREQDELVEKNERGVSQMLLELQMQDLIRYCFPLLGWREQKWVRVQVGTK